MISDEQNKMKKMNMMLYGTEEAPGQEDFFKKNYEVANNDEEEEFSALRYADALNKKIQGTRKNFAEAQKRLMLKRNQNKYALSQQLNKDKIDRSYLDHATMLKETQKDTMINGLYNNFGIAKPPTAAKQYANMSNVLDT